MQVRDGGLRRPVIPSLLVCGARVALIALVAAFGRPEAATAEPGPGTAAVPVGGIATVQALAAWQAARRAALARSTDALAASVEDRAAEKALATARLSEALQGDAALLAARHGLIAEAKRARAAQVSAEAVVRRLDPEVATGIATLAARARQRQTGAATMSSSSSASSDVARLRAALGGVVEPYAEALQRREAVAADVGRLEARQRQLDARLAALGSELRRLDEGARAADAALLTALVERGDAMRRLDALARHLEDLAERERVAASSPGLGSPARTAITSHTNDPGHGGRPTGPRLLADLRADEAAAPSASALLASARASAGRGSANVRLILQKASFGPRPAAPEPVPDLGPFFAPVVGTRVPAAAEDARVHGGGVLLETGVRQTVSAPTGGRVAFAEAFKGFGLLLIIDRGDGYHMLLSGFSRLDVGRGANVAAGQAVGVVGDRGGKARLYLELRRDGSPVDPSAWPSLREDRVRS